MGSDIARVSFDRRRGYRSVIVQQGRVTLEADANEAVAIADEAFRDETVDIIGPAGTPDNGYAVGSGKCVSDIVIGAGTMYVGGWRMRLEHPVHLNNQPDWLNLVAPEASQAQTLVALLVTEQSVSAVEDRALYEVALGGPDTAARSRLMQHFLALPMDGSTCELASAAVKKLLAQNGLRLDERTLAVRCDAALQVSFVTPTAPPDPCRPTAQGGYLGVDNQLVRVTITSYDPVSQSGTLAWGWNNASILFRASVSSNSQTTLNLCGTPIDAAHTPQPGQAVEILRTACVLGEACEQNYVAAAQGEMMTLGPSGVFIAGDPNQLVLPAALPPDYQSEPHSLFVRLWQGEVAFTAGEPVNLDGVSGLIVTVTLSALPSGLWRGATPYWQFAVRPNTPQQVYPQRYLRNAQPPNGPRQWLCNLAVVLAASAWPVGQPINAVDTTPFTPAAAVFGERLYLFWRSDDSSKYIYFAASVDGSTWPTGQPINETDTTLLAPATCAFNGQIYLFWQAADGSNQIVYSASKDGVTWSAGERISGTPTPSTGATPTACVFNDILYLFWQASENQIFFSSIGSTNDAAWSVAQPINATASTQAAPAACVFNGLLSLFWSANDGTNQIYISASSDGKTWSKGAPINTSDTTPMAPVAVAYDGELLLFWKSNDSNAIYTTASSDGTTWPPARTVNSTDTTPQPPAAVAFNSHLYLFWTANDPSNAIFWSLS